MEKYHPSPARVVSLPTPFITRTLTRTLTLGAGRAPLPLPHPYLGVGEFSVFRRIRTRYFIGGGRWRAALHDDDCSARGACRTRRSEAAGIRDERCGLPFVSECFRIVTEHFLVLGEHLLQHVGTQPFDVSGYLNHHRSNLWTQHLSKL